MSTPQDPGQSDQLLRMGPFKVVQVFTSHLPAGQPIAERTSCDSVPFSEIKHLVGKPLTRFTPADPQQG